MRVIGKRLYVAVILLALSGCASPERSWREAEAQGTQEAYKAFVERFPNHPLAVQAHARLAGLAWEAAERKNTRDAYAAFVAQYPKGARVAEAQTRIEGLAWASAKGQGTIEAYQRFLRDFTAPTNTFRPEAALDLGAGVALTRLEVRGWSADKNRPKRAAESELWKSDGQFSMTITRFVPKLKDGARCVELLVWFEQTGDKGGDYWFKGEAKSGFKATLVFAQATPSPLAAFLIPGLPFAGDTMVTTSTGTLGLGLKKKGAKTWAQLVFEVPHNERTAVLLIGQTPVVLSLPAAS
jgi:hypothetical protein